MAEVAKEEGTLDRLPAQPDDMDERRRRGPQSLFLNSWSHRGHNPVRSCWQASPRRRQLGWPCRPQPHLPRLAVACSYRCRSSSYAGAHHGRVGA
jgi:hypothetical protein